MKTMNAMKRYGAKIAAAGTGLMLSGLAMAEAIDIGPVVVEIDASKVAVAAIGTAVLGVIVSIAVFVWVRRAIR